MQVDTMTWTIGFIIGGIVIAVVVAVVVAIIATAARIRDQVHDVIAALEATRANTAPLWQMETTTNVSAAIVDLAQDAGNRLERQRPGGARP